MNWINVLIGLVLLIAGRRLFWLFVACVGFATGYHYVQQIGGIHSALLILTLAIAAGVLFFAFDWALIFLSTLTGASLIVQMVAFDPRVEMILFIVLVIAGTVFQAKVMTGGSPAQ